MKISILMPTRGRPDQFTRAWRSAVRQAAQYWRLELCLYIDEDDAASIPAQRALAEEFPDQIKAFIGPRIVLSECWNKAYSIATGEVLMHAGDDIIFQTPGWDNCVRSAFAKHPDKIVFAYGDDGYSPDTFGTHGFIHRNWAKTVGYFVPPYFSSDFNDTWLNEVARQIRRHYHIPIMTEHIHPVTGKVELDQTHRERIERHNRDNVEQIYADKAPERAADAEKLRTFIRNFTSGLQG